MNFHGGIALKDRGVLNDYSVNVPPFKMEQWMVKSLEKSLAHLGSYPEIDGDTPRKMIADRLEISHEQVILGNGATELIYLVARAHGEGRVGIVEPTFSEYRRAFDYKKNDILSFSRDLSHFSKIEAKALCHFINENRIGLLFLCNPNNPTGEFYDADWIETLLKGVKNTAFQLVLDESFIDFVKLDDIVHFQRMRELMHQYQIILIRSMTKTFSIPGIRVGYAVGSQKWVECLNRYKEPWTMNTFALDLMPDLMKADSYRERIKRWCAEEKEHISQAYKAFTGIDVFIGEANFYCIRLSEPHCDYYYHKMLEKGIHMRRCHDFLGMGKGYYRIAVKSNEDNIQFINTLWEAYHEEI